jgi:cytochrome c oxidase cbb3-type subunit 3
MALFCVPATAQHGSSATVNPYNNPEHERAGAALDRAQCAGCHGRDGVGTGAGPDIASGAFRHGSSDEALFRTLSKGVSGTSMPAFSAFSSLQIWQLVTHLRALGIARGATQAKGVPQAGLAIFRAECARCHAADGEGAFTAPDLNTLASRRSTADLRQSLTDPNADVASPYWSIQATTSAGATVRGTRLNEDTFSLQLRDPSGRLVSLLKRDLKNVELIRTSPMPSFSGKLSDSQIDDVIAWLISLGGALSLGRAQ